MNGHVIGYIRVSTFDQNPERQLEGVQIDRSSTDKASGKDVKRPQLEALISFARAGDTVVVRTIDRLARKLDDLHRIVKTGRSKRSHLINIQRIVQWLYPTKLNVQRIRECKNLTVRQFSQSNRLADQTILTAQASLQNPLSSQRS